MKRNLTLAAVLALLVAHSRAQKPVVQSARDIPVAYAVDVVVAGGTTGAVSAAVAAARQGASVFLAAPRPYLGEDMAAHLRLWLEEGETATTPLARRVFSKEGLAGQAAPRPQHLFAYTSDLPSAERHRDTRPPRLLSDGSWHSAATQSVQYDGDVTLVLDLGEEREVAGIRIMYYHRVDYRLGEIAVWARTDRDAWRQIALLTNTKPGQGGPGSAAYEIGADFTVKTRSLKLAVTRAAGSTRILLGEIQVIEPEAGAAPARPRRLIRPLHLKKVLDEALLDAGVEFLYSSTITDVMRDSSGAIRGVTMANRAGRQAVLANVIIDATEGAWVAALAGAGFRSRPPQSGTFTRVVIGGEVRTGKGMVSRLIDPPIHYRGRAYRVIEYTLELPLPADTPAARQELEQIARDRTFDPGQQFASEILFSIPRRAVLGREAYEDAWTGAKHVPLGAFEPRQAAGVYVLGGGADVSAAVASRLMRPVALMELGLIVGKAAGMNARRRPTPAVPPRSTARSVLGSEAAVRETLSGVRAHQAWTTIRQENRELPVLGAYDVVVVGGGTSGAPAAIAAARHGASTLVVEYLHGLGGVGTLGAISKYCQGYRGGFTKEVAGGASWQIEQRAEWWRTAIREAGGEIWFGTLGCGALVEDGRVTGVIVATPRGRGVVRARVVIDATGNADIAAAAGAPCVGTGAEDLAVQGTGLPPRELGASYTNTDFTIADDSDVVDITSLFVYSKAKYSRRTFDQGQLVDTRERRRIDGEFTVTILDQVNKRTYGDTIAMAATGYDTHGYTVHPFFTLAKDATRGRFRTFLPFRCFLPKGLEGLLVVGLGISVERDAQPLIRMQPDVQNAGYGAGVAAAMVCRDGTMLRDLDIRKVQRDLVEIGCLPKEVLGHDGDTTLSEEDLSRAVVAVRDGFKQAARLLGRPEQALPALRQAFGQAKEPTHRLAYAQLLAVMGDRTGVEILCDAVRAQNDWDAGWNYRAMGQFGRDMSTLDAWIFALGRAGDRGAVPVILAKVKLLDAEKAFSHHRAVALALERLADPAAAPPLAELLNKPGMSGHALTSVAAARTSHKILDPGLTALKPRRRALREITLARALFRCGDVGGLGKRILENYVNDLRGHFARHAAVVLAEGP